MGWESEGAAAGGWLAVEHERTRPTPLTSALMIAALASCSAIMTMNLERSASCCATCLLSMAVMNSLLKMRCVMLTSSSCRWYCAARSFRA